MKLPLLTVCLLATLSLEARAEPRRVMTYSQSSSEGRDASNELHAPDEALLAIHDQLKELQERRPLAERMDPLARLDAQQIFKLEELKAREQRRSGIPGEHAVPIIVSLSFFSCLLMGFLGWLLARHRRNHQIHETVRLMVEKGAEIPPGLLGPAPRNPSDLRLGIILVSAGLGLTIFLAGLRGARGAWGAGVTIFLLGVGHLIVWRLQRSPGRLGAEISSERQP